VKPNEDHRWPTDPAEHKWGPWLLDRAREGKNPPTQYRSCIDPTCGAAQHRQAPAG
jgi:hypothetical protein